MKMTKQIKKKEITIEDLEEQSRSEISGIRQDAKKRLEEEYLNAQFYFSVVFTCKKERDDWIAQQGIKLKDESYILAKDYDMSIKRR
ncbi:MAG: hypothetical protein C0436_00315 [Alphaproteobacteria bacterium]|nr:hypothetical protein [Alphaproteobacteria bacterium]